MLYEDKVGLKFYTTQLRNFIAELKLSEIENGILTEYINAYAWSYSVNEIKKNLKPQIDKRIKEILDDIV